MVDDVRKFSTCFIEISGACQSKCPYCFQQKKKLEKNYGAMMSPVLFERILDHLFEIEILEKPKDTVIILYMGGEPFLNPDINAILQIMKKRGLHTYISSNFMVKPEIDIECLPVISTLHLSLSGFSDESYGRIHGASLDQVLDNFEDFYTKIRKYSPGTKIDVIWHRYTFNEHEFWNAWKYFNRPGITFSPRLAFICDYFEMIDFLEGNLDDNRRIQVENDLFIEGMSKSLAYHKLKSKGYRCPGWDFLSIDEMGQLKLCCALLTENDKDHIVGNILEMSAEEIWKEKLSDPICNKCSSSGLARWIFFQQEVDGFKEKPWPSGGGLCHLKLWLQFNLTKPQLVQTAMNLPLGDKMLALMKKVKRSIF